MQGPSTKPEQAPPRIDKMEPNIQNRAQHPYAVGISPPHSQPCLESGMETAREQHGTDKEH